jgi:hypothetical protein
VSACSRFWIQGSIQMAHDTGEFNRQQAYIDSICPRKAARTNVLRLAWGVAGVYTYTGVNSLAMGLVECCR